MRKSFKLPTGWREPRRFMTGLVGLLIALNLIAMAFAFHVFGRSPREAADELGEARAALLQKRNQLNRTKQIYGKVAKGKEEGDQFLAVYMTPRRSTFSTIVSELQHVGESAGMSLREANYAPLDPVKGSEDLSKMTVTVTFEGSYPGLLKMINLLDRSQRFLIIESMASAPQPSGKLLSTLKINTFVRDDNGGAI